MPTVSQPVRRLEPAETWSGNGRTSGCVEMPGLRVFVHSTPSGPGAGGGDVHYASLCPSGIVSRVALADVSGHGEAVVALGERLRQLMLRHLTALEQVGLMRDLNRAVRQELDGVHYATMVAIGWHGPRGLLEVTSAGHPPPAWYRASRGDWSWIAGKPARRGARPAGVPLGLVESSTYDRTVLRPASGDLVLLYTDGVSEALNEAGDELGRDGLLGLVQAIHARTADAFGGALESALRVFRGSTAPTDDATLIVLERVAGDDGPR